MWIDTLPWKGRTALSDREVALAHAVVCERARKLEYHLSTREGAELASVSYQTFGKSTQRLVNAGIVHRVRMPVAKQAATYQLAEIGKGAIKVSYADTPSRSE